MLLSKKTNGFSLVEVLITIAILGIFTVVIGSITKLFQANFIGDRNTLETEQSVNAAMDMMIREIRGAQQSFTPVATTTSFQFKNKDGLTITYQFSGSTLQRKENTGSFITVTDNISNLTFTYTNKILTIFIKGSYQDREVQMKDSVALRNL